MTRLEPLFRGWRGCLGWEADGREPEAGGRIEGELDLFFGVQEGSLGSYL